MNHKIFILLSFTFIPSLLFAQGKSLSPIETIQVVADHIIASNPYRYELKTAKRKASLNELNYIDFGRTFGYDKPAVGYALSWLNSPIEQSLELELEYNDGLKVYLNDKEVYSDRGDSEAKIEIHERSLGLSEKVVLNLKQGMNKLLLKSETLGKRWVVYLRSGQKENLPLLGLSGLPFIAEDLASLSNWLIVGPFENPTGPEGRSGLDTVYPPEQLFETGQLYDGRDGKVTWTMPRLEVLAHARPIDPIWGSYLNYNYHTGGVAWAMMHLSEYTGEERFMDYAHKYTDFMIETRPFVRYQMEVLNEYTSVNYHMINVPLLDFTLAPSLPFIYRLIQDGEFGNRQAYEEWVEGITHYALNEQVRLNGEHFTRLTPRKYTTWVDDMFMGLPYLIHAARLTDDEALRNRLFDDAARQILSFNTEVWDEDAKLYQHAQYSDERVKMPHWSRANGWGIWAVTEVLKELPRKHTLYKKILNHYREHVNSLVQFQTDDGFWRNVMDVEESVKETSGTAIFVMAIARGINEGWLKKKDYEQVVLKGWGALDSVIDDDGTVHDICMGTMCSEDISYYLNRPIVKDDSHGMLGLIAAAIEVQRMLDEK